MILMPTPCRLYRIFPSYFTLFYELFLEKKKTHTYQRYSWKIDKPELELKIYSDPLGEDEFGIPCNIEIDIPVSIWNRDEGSISVKATKGTFLRTYNIGSERLLALYSSQELTQRVQIAISSVMKETEPDTGDLVLPMSIDLKEKEQELNKEFTEVRRFWMKDMPDLYVRSTGISGVKLQDSPEYKRYVQRMDGNLMSLVFRWQGITILLSSDGLIFTYTNFPSYRESSLFFKTIIDKLIKVDALKYAL
jgi:hypothetical protein